jgi:hypothetical protein
MVMKKYLGHDWETHESWHPVVIRRKGNLLDDVIFLSSWLNEYCPNADEDYDAWAHPDDEFSDSRHRSVYFFRDPEVAMLFALKWS